MRYGFSVLMIIFVPVCGAFILPVIGKWSRDVRNITAALLVGFSVAGSALLVPFVLQKNILHIQAAAPVGILGSFVVDGLSVFMALTSALVGLIIVLYSFGYISHYPHQNEYYLMVVLFLGAMMGVVYSANLLLLYIFWEITALCSWRLIGFYRQKIDVLRADKAFLVTFFGSVLMLLGILRIYQQAGSFDLAVVKSYFAGRPLSDATILLILAGVLAKSATLPLQSWLPDAGVAPAPVTALLHAAVLVKIGVYVFARLFVVTLALGAFWSAAVPWIAAASALIAAAAAFIETDMKRIIAYSTISQIGFIFFGLALGTEIGVAAGLLFILMHGLAKAGLFLCAGIIEQNTHTKDITQLGGLIHTMPRTAFAFLICAFSVMGIPPLGGFFSKYLVFMAGLQSGQWAVSAVFLLAAVATIAYLWRFFSLVFLGQVKVAAKESSPIMVASVVALALLSAAGGILIFFPAALVKVATAAMRGG